MRGAHLAAAIAAGLLLASCDGGEGPDQADATGTTERFDRQEEQVAAGETPPDPDDLGLGDDVEPRERDTLDLDVATFTSRWNDSAVDAPVDGVAVDEWTVGYAMPSGDLTHEWADWLAVFGAWSYTDGQLEYVMVEWSFDPAIDGDLIFSAVVNALVVVAGGDDAAELVSELGIDTMDEEALEQGIDTEVERDGVSYQLFTDDFGGELEILPS